MIRIRVRGSILAGKTSIQLTLDPLQVACRLCRRPARPASRSAGPARTTPAARASPTTTSTSRTTAARSRSGSGKPPRPRRVFTGMAGHTYGFYSVATDNVGNREATPTAAEATTTDGNTTVITWINTAGGDWDTPSNWDLGRVPARAIMSSSISLALPSPIPWPSPTRFKASRATPSSTCQPAR